MRRNIIRILCLTCTVLMLGMVFGLVSFAELLPAFQPTGQQNFTSATIPTNLTVAEQKYLDGAEQKLKYSKYNYKSSTKETLVYTMELAPNSDIRPLVGWSGKVGGGSYVSLPSNTKTVPQWAQYYEDKGYNVMGAVNGDYFLMAGSTGTKAGNWLLANNQTLGKIMTDGIIRDFGVTALKQGVNTNADCMGIKPDGSVVIGRPEVTAKLKYNGTEYPVEFMNRVWNNKAYYADIMVFNEDYGRILPINNYLVNEVYHVGNPFYLVVCEISPESGKMAFNSTVKTVIKSKTQIAANYTINSSNEPTSPLVSGQNCYDVQPGEFVVACESNAFYNAVKAGDSVDMDIVLNSSAWADVSQIIGGRCQILKNGVATGFDLGTGEPTGLNPRSIVGVKSDGTVVTVTVDGRQSGALIVRDDLILRDEILPMLQQMGIVDALLFDGGGSVTLTTRNESGVNVLTNMTSNNPEGTILRSVATSFLFAKPPTSTQNIAGVANGGVYSTERTITFPNGVGMMDGKAFYSGEKITTEGTHTLTVLESFSKTVINFTINKTPLVVTGAAEGITYMKSTTISFSKGTATLKKDNGTATPFVSGTAVSVNGTYLLTVYEDSEKVTNINFTIELSGFYYNENGTYLTAVTPGTKVEDFILGMGVKAGESAIVQKTNGGEVAAGTSLITTGMTVKVVNNTTGIARLNLTIIIYGDVNQDGAVNATDVLFVKRHVLNLGLLTGDALYAGNVNKDEFNSVNATDVLYIKRHVLNLSPIVQ